MIDPVLWRQRIVANRREGKTKTVKTTDSSVFTSGIAARCNFPVTSDSGMNMLQGKFNLPLTIGL